MLCDKRIICVDPTPGVTFKHEYRAIKEAGDIFYLLNDKGSFAWYAKSRFVESGYKQ